MKEYIIIAAPTGDVESLKYSSVHAAVLSVGFVSSFAPSGEHERLLPPGTFTLRTSLGMEEVLDLVESAVQGKGCTLALLVVESNGYCDPQLVRG